jgi:myo-inositol-1(or 4)-monophosphatase
MGLNPWDVGAGLYLVRAAGGRVSDFTATRTPGGDHVVASNGHLHDWLRATVLGGLRPAGDLLG